MQLRPYQSAAIEAPFRYWHKGGGNPLIEIPTGGGKTLIISSICKRMVEEHKARVLIAAHRKELLLQNEATFKRLWPNAPIGVFSSGLGRREIRQITIAGIQSIFRQPKKMGHVDLLIIDEAHLLSPKVDGQYGKLIEALRHVNGSLRILGLTATPYRLGQGLLTQGEGKIFDSIVYRAHIKDLIDQGYLSAMHSSSTSGKVETDGIKIINGEFLQRDLELAANVSEVTEAVVRDVLATNRKHCLVFGVGVEHASFLRNAFRMAGASAEVITGSTPPQERARILDSFKAGQLRVLTSCDVLTTGFDAPLVDCLALVRPTMSPGLYVQMVGRGSRLAPGKENCIVLDYGGNIARHGPIDEVTVKPKSLKPGIAAQKMCPSCCAEIPVSRRRCDHCDHEFPHAVPQERKANVDPSQLAIIGGTKKQKMLAVTQRIVVEYESHRSGARMLRVDYHNETQTAALATEFICIEHDGYARTKAEQWWFKMTGTPCPNTVAEAMEQVDMLRPVAAIGVQQDGKFKKVVAWGFPKQRQPGEDDDDDTIAGGGHDDDLPF